MVLIDDLLSSFCPFRGSSSYGSYQLKKNRRSHSTKTTWTEVVRQAFHDIKTSLADSTLPVYPQEPAHTRLQIDTSDHKSLPTRAFRLIPPTTRACPHAPSD
ncbi:UNVERIFIED_CONTAM: hypothetical protein RMT77_005083 [Armadillidium vulgare]